MSFRTRLTLVAAVAVALAVVAASAVVYVVVRGQLRRTLDHGLTDRAAAIQHTPPDHVLRPPTFENGYVQLVGAAGSCTGPLGGPCQLPVDSSVRRIARTGTGTRYSDVTVADIHLRVLAFPYQEGFAVQVARPLTDVDRALSRIRLFLILIAGGGIAVAAALGLAVSRAALAPVRRLTHATETVAETGDLSGRIEAGGRDELSRLASSFNTMLAALETSTRAQRQLVADASHELRTPLTSLRTNIEVLRSGDELPEGERDRLLTDVVEQLSEMTTLIAELIELARGEQHPSEPEEVRLDLVTERAVERARRNRPAVVYRTDLHQATVTGVPATLERAVGNLLDNAGKWSPAGAEVDVTVRDGEVVVRDRGPGIDDSDLPFVFDRFYRAASARGMAGSGLGLAIVQQVAKAHGGEVVAERPSDGGLRMRLRLPLAVNGSGPEQ
jgi:two-component system sensor histidine kinase MprB